MFIVIVVYGFVVLVFIVGNSMLFFCFFIGYYVFDDVWIVLFFEFYFLFVGFVYFVVGLGKFFIGFGF